MAAKLTAAFITLHRLYDGEAEYWPTLTSDVQATWLQRAREVKRTGDPRVAHFVHTGRGAVTATAVELAYQHHRVVNGYALDFCDDWPWGMVYGSQA